jgi:hypothetical protein
MKYVSLRQSINIVTKNEIAERFNEVNGTNYAAKNFVYGGMAHRENIANRKVSTGKEIAALVECNGGPAFTDYYHLSN